MYVHAHVDHCTCTCMYMYQVPFGGVWSCSYVIHGPLMRQLITNHISTCTCLFCQHQTTATYMYVSHSSDVMYQLYTYMHVCHIGSYTHVGGFLQEIPLCVCILLAHVCVQVCVCVCVLVVAQQPKFLQAICRLREGGGSSRSRPVMNGGQLPTNQLHDIN